MPNALPWKGFGDAPAAGLHPGEDGGHFSGLGGLGVPALAWGRGSAGPGVPAATRGDSAHVPAGRREGGRARLFPREGILGPRSAAREPRPAQVGLRGAGMEHPRSTAPPAGSRGMGGRWGGEQGAHVK